MGGGISGNPGTAGANGSGSSGGSGSESGPPVNISVSIPAGSSGDRIADILAAAGLIKDRQEFNQAVDAAGAEGKLRAGDFVIPSDATPAEIISILTR
jgi:cell division protein YceG involved in septum cleavage